MKAGRNDTCPCGSGKKFKKCCLGKMAASPLVPKVPHPFLTADAEPRRSADRKRPEPPRRDADTEERDLLREKWDAYWNEFKTATGEQREAIFLRDLDDREIVDDDTAIEMLSSLHRDAIARGDRQLFRRVIDIIAERRPDLYQESSHDYLAWQLLDALVDDRPEVPTLARALAAHAGEHLDVVNQSLEELAYHGRFDLILEMLRIGWPLVRESKKLVAWAPAEFAERGAAYEMYAYLDQTSAPDPADPQLLERIRFFIDEPRLEYVAEFIGDVSGQNDRDWSLADFALRPPHTPHERDQWDDGFVDADDKAEPPVDPGSQNLFHLIQQFIGSLHRQKGVPYPRLELIRHELHRYFIRRHQGELNPRLSMLEAALHPKKKPPQAPRPSHPLCPERVTFEVCVASMFGMFSTRQHKAAALFEIVPAWLRYLQSKGLIDEAQRTRTMLEFQPLHASFSKLMETYLEDPTPARTLKDWYNAP